MHPLGLNLGFMFGRGYLSAQGHPMSEWATLETLRMEIPDLTFPFDARGGARRFQNTRCHVRNIQIVLGEAGLETFLRRCLAEAPGSGFTDLRLRFLDGAAHARLRVNTLGADTFITFKASAIPPEPIRGDTLHVVFHDVRSYGPLPYPARLVLSEFLGQLLASPALQQDSPGEAFMLAQRGDLLELRPLKLTLLHTFPRQGWKLPGLHGITFEAIRIQPGALSISARSDGDHWERHASGDPRADTAASRLGAQALAAYEARDLFREADVALFEGRLAQALELLRNLRHIYGRHPVLLEHLLDTLLTFPGPGHLSEARGLIDELLRAQPDHLRALLAAPTLALLRGDPQQAAAAYHQLAERLRERQETADLIACLLAAARVQRPYDPTAAVRLLKEVVQLSPREAMALEQLRELYAEQDEVDGLIDTLKRLAGLTTDRDRLLSIYQELAELLMNRRNDLAEARLYLERILRLEPDQMQALCTLGDSWVLDDQPLRAIKAFGAAARFAVEHGDLPTAARLQLKNAGLWRDLGDLDSALLAAQRALHHAPEDREALELAVALNRQAGRVEEVLRRLDTLIPIIERSVEHQHDPDARQRALDSARQIHLTAARIAQERDRLDAAAAHHQRALAWRRLMPPARQPEEDPSVEFLDTFWRQMGRPEDLIDLYRAELDNPNLPPARQARLHHTLATLYEQVLGLASEASDHLQRALELTPDDPALLDALVALLTRRGRTFELKALLTDLQGRVTRRAAQAHLLRELGALARAEDPERAVALLQQAQTLSPTDVTIARLLTQLVLERLQAARDTRDAREQVRAALRALERLAEVSEEPDEQLQALLRAGDLCAERLRRPTEAASFYRRALALRDDPVTRERLRAVEQRPTSSSQRLDAVSRRTPPPDVRPFAATSDVRTPLDPPSRPSGSRDSGRHRPEPEPRPTPPDLRSPDRAPRTLTPDPLPAPRPEPHRPEPFLREPEVEPTHAEPRDRDTPEAHPSLVSDVAPPPAHPNDWSWTELTEDNPTASSEALPAIAATLSGDALPAVASTTPPDTPHALIPEAPDDDLAAPHQAPPEDLFADLALDDDEPDAAPADAPPRGRPRYDAPRPPYARPTPEEANTREISSRESATLAQASQREASQREASPENLRLFRARFQELIKKPASLKSSLDNIQDRPRGASPSVSISDDEVPTLSSIRAQLDALGVAPTTRQEPEPPTDEAPSDDDAHQGAAQRNAILAQLGELKESGDPQQVRAGLEALLGDPALTDDLRARVERDLGLHCYYELEELEAAEGHLLTATELDPSGIGRDFDVLTAMEGVYEDLDDPEGLVRVYRRKRDCAETAQMATVYGLLMAEVLHERLGQREAARELLEELLADHPEHEPALHMLAAIAREEGDHVRAAQVLRRILQHQIAGSFERQETARELGRLMLQAVDERPDDPKRLDGAIDAWRGVLAEAPGDGEARGALKELLLLRGDRDEVLTLLGYELGALLGRPEAFTEGPDAEALAELELSPALALPTSQILTESATLLRDAEPDRALALLTRSMSIWPDQVEALDMKAELLRALLAEPSRADEREALAEALVEALEQLVALMLNPSDQLGALREAAAVAQDHLSDALAQPLQARAEEVAALVADDPSEGDDPIAMQAPDDPTVPGELSHIATLIAESQHLDALLDLAGSAAQWGEGAEAAELRALYVDRVADMLQDDSERAQALDRLAASHPATHDALQARLEARDEEPTE